jgi:hypothetical protein
VSVVLGGAAIAAGARALYAGRMESALEMEIAAVKDSGLLERERAAEDAELVEARNRLDEILRRIREADAVSEGCAFGAPCMQRPEQSDRLAAGLAARAELLAELDELPELLWDSAREPSRSTRQASGWNGERMPSNSLIALRSATNLLCGQAWQAAREPQGGSEAGYRLALALAMARVCANGGGFELGIRIGMEGIVVDTLERLRAEGTVDRRLLDAPLLRELARDDHGDRLRLAVECDLAAAVENLSEGRDVWSGSLEGPSRIEALSTSLDFVRFQREQLLEDLTKRHMPPFVPGVLPTAPGHEMSRDIHALWRDLSDNLRARILCTE